MPELKVLNVFRSDVRWNRNDPWLVLPKKSIQYFLGSIGIIMGGALLIENALLASLERDRQVNSQSWQDENQRINQNNEDKNLATGIASEPTEDWVWHSEGLPVSSDASVPYRILVMGDSFVWGDGYANVNDVWWRQLDRELQRRGFTQVDVIAAGMNGASTRQQLAQARNLVPRYNPDLIIWGYVTNDPDEEWVKRFDYSVVASDPTIQILDSSLLSAVFPRLTSQLRDSRQRKIVNMLEGDEYGYSYSNWELQLLENPTNFARYQETIAELGEFIQSSGIPSFVVTLPNSPNVEQFTSRYSPVLPLLEAQRIPTLNLIDRFVTWAQILNSEATDSILMWGINPANGHPSAASTYFYAVQVANFLEENYPDVLGTPADVSQPPTAHVNDWVPFDLNVEQPELGVITFNYPASEESMLRMPVERPFVQLNLEFPVEIAQIQVSGTSLEQATVDLTTINAIGFDDGRITTLPTQSGNSLTWDLVSENISDPVNTIRISADFLSEKQQLTLTLIPLLEN